MPDSAVLTELSVSPPLLARVAPPATAASAVGSMVWRSSVLGFDMGGVLVVTTFTGNSTGDANGPSERSREHPLSIAGRRLAGRIPADSTQRDAERLADAVGHARRREAEQQLPQA